MNVVMMKKSVCVGCIEVVWSVVGWIGGEAIIRVY